LDALVNSSGYGVLRTPTQEILLSSVGVVLFGEVRVFHKPHPSPNLDKGAVAALRDWFEQHGVTP